MPGCQNITCKPAYLSRLDGLTSEGNTVSNFGRDAEVLEESLVGRPELPPHGLAHAVLRLDQVCCLLEHGSGLHPLKTWTHTPLSIFMQGKQTITPLHRWKVNALKILKLSGGWEEGGGGGGGPEAELSLTGQKTSMLVKATTPHPPLPRDCTVSQGPALLWESKGLHSQSG